MLESPSRTMLSNPNSRASSKASVATNVSTFVGGRGTNCEKEAISKPSVFCLTTPNHVLLSFSNMAPSKLTL